MFVAVSDFGPWKTNHLKPDISGSIFPHQDKSQISHPQEGITWQIPHYWHKKLSNVKLFAEEGVGDAKVLIWLVHYPCQVIAGTHLYTWEERDNIDWSLLLKEARQWLGKVANLQSSDL